MLTDQFLQYIKSENLFQPDTKLILGISGGLDSVVLCELLYQVGQPFCLAHMNFQLRGEDSDQDEAFVRSLAKEKGIECYVNKVNVKAVGKGHSIQMKARTLRYQWFDQLRKQGVGELILTAHHANDLLETALLNIIRGTSIKGIRSILPKGDHLVRPLLFASREELLSYAKINNLQWREDASNAEKKYRRNLIRHDMIPLMEKMNPQLIHNFALNSKRLRLAEHALLKNLSQLKEKYLHRNDQHYELDLAILKEDEGMQYMYEMLLDFGFQYPQLMSFDFDRVGAVLEGAKYTINVDRGKLLIKSFLPSESVEEIELPLIDGKVNTPAMKVKVKLAQGNKVLKQAHPYQVQLDGQLAHKTAKIRLWQEGDRFQPLGMKGQKKVSDFLIDEKVPLFLKNKVMVLTVDEEIVWLIGYRISEKYKLNATTTKHLSVTIDLKAK